MYRYRHRAYRVLLLELSLDAMLVRMCIYIYMYIDR